MPLRRTAVVTLLVGALMATAACGARLTEAQREQALATGGTNQGGGDGSLGTGDLGAPVTATASSFTVAVTGDPTGGTYTLEVAVDDGGAEATEPVAHDADAAALQTAIEGVSTVGPANATVDGDGPFTVTFAGELATTAVDLAVGELALTGGNDPNVTVEPIEADSGGETAAPTPGGGSGAGDAVSPDEAGGGGGGGGTGGGGGACAPGSATGPGVTPTEIKVGNVSQISGLVPGFGQTGVNGARAYFNMVNNQGGVCGRQITLVTADDRFQAATNRSETDKLADQVLAFVGSTSVVDDGGAPVIDAKGVADVSLATTPVRVRAANNFSPNPIDPTPGVGNGIAKIFSYFMETQGAKTAALFYQDAAVGVVQAENYKIDMQKAGLELVATYPVAVTATNFRSQANDMKQKDV
ncbi:MAG: ABC transporter substrate-binding protein, partial [Acidimicrobiales bacterium]